MRSLIIYNLAVAKAQNLFIFVYTRILDAFCICNCTSVYVHARVYIARTYAVTNTVVNYKDCRAMRIVRST